MDRVVDFGRDALGGVALDTGALKGAGQCQAVSHHGSPFAGCGLLDFPRRASSQKSAFPPGVNPALVMRAACRPRQAADRPRRRRTGSRPASDGSRCLWSRVAISLGSRRKRHGFGDPARIAFLKRECPGSACSPPIATARRIGSRSDAVREARAKPLKSWCCR